MIEHPENKLDWFDLQPSEYVFVHYESTVHVQRILQRIKDKGAKLMLPLNPATPLCVLENVIDDLDAVLIMTVNPGYAGQVLIPHTLGKIERLRQWLNKIGKSEVEIEVDGNVSFANAKLMREAGADIFVAGLSSVFNKNFTLEDTIRKLRENTQ